MKHGLFRGEFRNRRQNTSCITSKQDDVGGVIHGKTRDLCVVDVLDGVCARYDRSVLCLAFPHLWSYHRVFSVSVASS